MTKICKKYKYITYLSNNNWGYPIGNAITKAITQGKVPPLSVEFNKEVGDLMLAFSTRIDCLPIIIKRINNNAVNLYKEVAKRDKTQDHCGYKPKGGIEYELLIDINSFLFETHAGLKTLEALGRKILRKCSKIKIGPKDPFLRNILIDAKKSAAWLDQLSMDRGHFAHAGMPWIAVCLDNEPKTYDLLIMKKNLKEFDNPDNFFRLSDLGAIHRGFGEAAMAVQNYLSINVGK